MKSRRGKYPPKDTLKRDGKSQCRMKHTNLGNIIKKGKKKEMIFHKEKNVNHLLVNAYLGYVCVLKRQVQAIAYVML